MIAGFFIFLLKAKIKPLHLLFAILLGLVAIVPGSLIQYFIPKNILFVNYPILHSLIVSLLIYGLSEEIFKTVFILPLPKKDYSPLLFLCLSMMVDYHDFLRGIKEVRGLNIAWPMGIKYNKETSRSHYLSRLIR